MLQKALNPSVWPLRVKVREFIHYSKRNQQQKEKSKAQEQSQSAGHSGGQQEKRDSLLSPNRFEGLENDTSGDIPV